MIFGGGPLKGEVDIRGSKNVASKLMIASLLTPEPCTIENVPLSSETHITRELCEMVGSSLVFDDNHKCSITTPTIKTSLVGTLSGRNRIPILALGPLLHRSGFAEVPVVGGCYLGHRPINFHVEALSKMGVKVERREGSYYTEAENIHGADIEFAFPSVGATETVLLTASLARGVTRLKNAAVEPEVINLIQMLNSMGARIKFQESPRIIKIEGVSKLHGATAQVMPDRNEIVSFACAALMTKGDVFILGAQESYIKSFLQKVFEIGGSYQTSQRGIRFFVDRDFLPTQIETMPHPGFMTDWQQPFLVLLTQIRGESIIHETVYEDRFGFVKDLNRMGAHIELTHECLGNACRFYAKTYNHSVKITGPTKLSGSNIHMTDIRAGMAHIIAALGADGESQISGIEHVDRGYEKIDERLKDLGADIKRV